MSRGLCFQFGVRSFRKGDAEIEDPESSSGPGSARQFQGS